MSHEFELRKEIELAATPEEVWDAIATGPGIDSWFMGRSEIEPGEGGATSLTMAGHTETSTITEWEPQRRFGHRTEPGEDGTFMAFEYLIEGRVGGGTVLRLVQSGVLGDDWETEYEAMAVGWDMYLHKLAQYLAHFRGRTATPVTAVRPGVDQDRGWDAVRAEFGLGEKAAEGDRIRLAVPGLAPVEGVVDYVALPSFLGVRTEDAMYRFIHSGPQRGNVLVLGHHLFASGQGGEKAWQEWLDALAL